MNFIKRMKKALAEFNESGALATNECPDYLRDLYFKTGFKSGVKSEKERVQAALKELGYTYERDCIFTTLFPEN